MTTSPHVWVQYKGTQLCADFHCSCGARGHIDDGFAYTAECGACGQVWVLPMTLPLIRVEDADPDEFATGGDPVWVQMHADIFGGRP